VPDPGAGRSRILPAMRPILISLLVLAVACERPATPSAERAPSTAGVVDSALPIDTLLARFRATVTDTPTALGGGERSPEGLTRALLGALQAQDTATLQRLVLSRAEFAWLYYPHTRFTRPPYELGPELLWLQMGMASEKGIVRLIRRYGGSPLRFEALTCPDSALAEGPNRVTTGCRVRFAVGDSAARELGLFGSLLQRDGRYKFVSYANEL
jgi:hypothetical protein